MADRSSATPEIPKPRLRDPDLPLVIERAIARRAGPMTRQQWIEQAILKHLAREERSVAEGD